MQLRTVQDTVRWPNGELAAGQVITFTLVGSSFTANELVMPTTYQVTTSVLGAFSLQLWCNEEGEAPTLWSAKLPDGTTFRFVLEAGAGPITLTQLRTTAEAMASSRQALYALLDQRYAMLGSEAGAITDHGQLDGRTDDDHPQYLNQARGDARYSQLAHAHPGYASTGHAHDERYYTEAEVDTKLGTKAAVGHTHVPEAHTHDTQYYTEAEVDTKLAAKSDTTHNHDASYASAGHNHAGAYQPAGSYAPGVHNHDDRYFTESEVTAALGGKADSTHTHPGQSVTYATSTQPLGVAAPGVAETASRGDHVHQMPTAADVGASPSGHNHAGVYQPAGSYAAAAHSHGIADLPVAASGVSDVTKVVRSDDARLSDARTPTAHNHDSSYYTEAEMDTALAGKAASTHSHLAADLPNASETGKGIVELATSAETAAGLAVQASDTRLSDARTPLTHSHGIADLPVAASAESSATKVVRADDSRLSDARTPTTHSHVAANLPDATTTGKGIVELATDGESAANLAVQANDSRLSNARTPTTHSHLIADLPVAASGVSDATKVTRSDDSRLSDARTPTAHDHDTRYYTESEIDTALAGKSNTGHTHTVSNITDYKFPPLAMSFSQNGDIYFVAHEAMTLATPVVAGTGTLAYNKALAATPTSFSSFSFPGSLAQGDILKVTCSGISGYKALTAARTA